MTQRGDWFKKHCFITLVCDWTNNMFVQSEVSIRARMGGIPPHFFQIPLHFSGISETRGWGTSPLYFISNLTKKCLKPG